MIYLKSGLLFWFFSPRCHLPVKTEGLGFSYLVSCSSNSDDMVWVQGSDALIHQGTAVGARGHDDVFASRSFCQLEAKGTHAQHSPDGPAQHCISSCLKKRHRVMINHWSAVKGQRERCTSMHLGIAGSIIFILGCTFERWQLKRTTWEPRVRNLLSSPLSQCHHWPLSVTLWWCITSCLQWLADQYLCIFCTWGTICNWKNLVIWNIVIHVTQNIIALHQLKGFFFKLQ